MTNFPGAFENVSMTNMSITYEDWDPILQKDFKEETPTQQCSYRIKRDLMSLCNDPPYGLFVVPDESDITIVHALITGAFDTPYEGGFFYFILRCPPDYPLRPPKVKLMTTGGGDVRFNPNLYKSGKVCLSILGTWSGPCWSPAQSICSVLISIQSILNEKPYHNEPGFEQEKLPGDVEKYNDIIQHETIRVAVCGMIENDSSLTIPPMLVTIMQKTFLEYYDLYESVAQKNLGLTGHPMQDPFSEKRGRFQYESILARLQAIRAKLLASLNAPPSTETSDAPTSEISSPSDTDLDEDSSHSGLNTNESTIEPAVSDAHGTSKQMVDAAVDKSSEECGGTSATLNHSRDNFEKPSNIETETEKTDEADG
ncbi:ubiquitin-conjugating enzyme E2 Z-like [Thrips palmi]|uniref:Ubiquitin-conjugating enzyme E2 Z n=1 Tax=Thrips palmi TaxID=161013 RepID=A0A6P8Z4S9_THRPL|nr:ubiquitin-conjugating enzyme E2 Z-like [Thrips palmi]